MSVLARPSESTLAILEHGGLPSAATETTAVLTARATHGELNSRFCRNRHFDNARLATRAIDVLRVSRARNAVQRATAAAKRLGES